MKDIKTLEGFLEVLKYQTESSLEFIIKKEIVKLASCLSVGIFIKNFPSLLLIVEMFDPETEMLAKANSFFVLLSKIVPLK